MSLSSTAFMELELFVQNKQEAPRRQSSKQNADAGRGAVGGGFPSLPTPFPDWSQHQVESRWASG